MNLPLIVNPEAEADLADAKDWYDSQRAGLGDDLLECVEEVFDRVRRMPQLFGKVFQELRLARVRRFPYVVVYRIDDDQITVVAVYHTRRDPTWVANQGLTIRCSGPGPPPRFPAVQRFLSAGRSAELGVRRRKSEPERGQSCL